MLRTLAIATLFIASQVHWMRAEAQNVYKCGDSYSQQPCAGGTAIQAGDPRSSAQKAQTDAATKRDAKTADAMEKARLKEEAAAVAAAPQAKATPQPKLQAKPQPEAPARKAKAKKPENFTATVPGSGDKAKKKKPAKKEG